MAYAQRDEIVNVDPPESVKRQEKPNWTSRLLNPKNVFLGVGTVLLIMLSAVPIWNAMILLQDSNYVFWAGRRTPQVLITVSLSIVILYAISISLFFRSRQGETPGTAHMEQTIMMIANIFITLFGLFLMLVSLPLTHQSELTYTNLLHRCDYSEQTHRLFEYSQVLQNMRAQPACAKKYSVEECEGYEEAAPYTSFLKGMENNFLCAGFCYRPPVLAAAGPGPSPGPSPAASPAPAKSLLSVRHHHADHVTQISLAAEGKAEVRSLVADLDANIPQPPTLFSDRNFPASCEGMAARDMKNFAGDIGQQTFFQGIYLIVIAVTTGFLKLAGFCIRKA